MAIPTPTPDALPVSESLIPAGEASGLTDTGRIGQVPDFDAAIADTTIDYESGIRLIGPLTPSQQRGRVRIAAGGTASWVGLSGAQVYGLLGLGASAGFPNGGELPVGMVAPPGYVASRPNITSHTFSSGDRVVVMKPSIPPFPSAASPRVYCEDAVLIECDNLAPEPALSGSWPSSLVGMTDQDVRTFLDETAWWWEAREGWSARSMHAWRAWPDSEGGGYGAQGCNVTSLGAMLMCSNLSASAKLAVQTRLIAIAHDYELFGWQYDANGGHGNGRLFPWLVRMACVGGATSVLSATAARQSPPTGPPSVTWNGDFSEVQQVYDNGGTPDWRFSPFDQPGNQSYRVCCTANRWHGAAVACKLAAFLGFSASDFVSYTMSYLALHEPAPGGEPAYYFSYDPRMAQLLRLNRATIGF